jgi:7,8-dihydropterin-6-yl-methyl-4-(beta-D-ribofuranosyl)aminobenzene 5'-phosphate synthase
MDSATIAAATVCGPDRSSPRTVAALAADHPTVIVPAHCTSWQARHALPDAFRPNAVGSRFDL